jgi:hypothetical protein
MFRTIIQLSIDPGVARSFTPSTGKRIPSMLGEMFSCGNEGRTNIKFNHQLDDTTLKWADFRVKTDF